MWVASEETPLTSRIFSLYLEKEGYQRIMMDRVSLEVLQLAIDRRIRKRHVTGAICGNSHLDLDGFIRG